MRARHIPEEKITVLNQESELERLEWRRQCFITDPREEKDAEAAKDKDKVEDPPEKQKMPLKETTSSEPRDSGLSVTTPLGFGPKATTIPNTKTRDPKETLPPSTETRALVDPVTPTPLSSKVPEHEISEEVIPLGEYKFDHSKLAVVMGTPKCKRTLVGGVEKALIEGFEESTRWDISGLDVAHVGVETYAVNVGMALTERSSSKAMAKEIFCLKQLVAQTQNELTDSIKRTADERQRSLDELKIALTVQVKEEKRQLLTLHSQELGLQAKIESTLQEKQEIEALKAIRDQALITKI